MTKRLYAWAIERDVVHGNGMTGVAYTNLVFTLIDAPPGRIPASEPHQRLVRLPWLDHDQIAKPTSAKLDYELGDYELGRLDERVSVRELLIAVEMVLREVVNVPPQSHRPWPIVEVVHAEAKRVLDLVREYQKQTEKEPT